MVDLAKELGYADGTAVTQIVKRLEAAAATNKPLQGKLKTSESHFVNCQGRVAQRAVIAPTV
jgi:hypothetical protein